MWPTASTSGDLMTNRIAVLALTLMVAACSSTPTSISLDVSYDQAWQLDELDVDINGKSSTTGIKSRIRVLVPDPWGGQSVTIAIDGLRDGVPFARGEAQVNLRAGGDTGVTVILEPLAGPACDSEAEDQCTEIPEPTCISGTTLRTVTAVGECVDNVCEFPFIDTECTNGCVDGACVCDVVHEGDSFGIAVTTVEVDRTFKVNGMLVPDTTLNGYGALTLRNTLTGDVISWGSTYQAASRIPVIAGRYDVYYALSAVGSGSGGAITVPRNTRAKIATVDLMTSTTIDLDVTVVRADRTFKVNGSSVPDTTANGYGSLFLRGAGGDEIPWGATYNTGFPMYVVAQPYDVYYENETLGSGTGGVQTVPRNTRARIATTVTPTATPMALDVATTMIDRTFKVNGALVPDSSANGYGELTVRNTTTGDEIYWGLTYNASYRMQVIAGTYDVYYEVQTGGTGTGGVVTVPRNTSARVATAVTFTTTPLDINVTAVRADRVFKVNGAVLTDTTVNGYGALYLKSATGDDVTWGQTYSNTSPLQIMAGTYDVVYELASSGSGAGGAQTVPRNTSAIVAANASITSTTPLNIDVTTVRADRVFKVNGAILTDTTINGYGSLHLVNAASGDDVTWGSTYQPSAPMTVIAGTYDVVYLLSSAGSGAGGATTVPRNPEARVATALPVTSTNPIDLSVNVVRVDRTFTVNGVAVPDTSVNGYGALYLRDLRWPEETSWGSTYQTMARVPVLAGSYDVMYELTSPGSGAGGAVVVPHNDHASLGCLEVMP
jgi:hypothetical protein